MGSARVAPAAEVRPRRIYTYWHELPVPDCVQRCIGSMRLWNPEWEVVVLTPASVSIPADAARLPLANQSDWVRLEVLSERGGVWLDASIICTAPVEQWAGTADTRALVGFELHARCMESFAFACPPRHPLVLAWRDEFGRAIARGPAAYCADPRVVELVPPRLQAHMPYLVVYACFLATRAAHPHLADARLLQLQPADATEGPYWYLSTALFGWQAWNAERIVAHLATRASVRAPLTKLTRHTRPELQRRIDTRDYAPDSIMRTCLQLPAPWDAMQNAERSSGGVVAPLPGNALGATTAATLRMVVANDIICSVYHARAGDAITRGRRRARS